MEPERCADSQGSARSRSSIGTPTHKTFIGPDGKVVLETIVPTAVLLNVDETILNLPWELIGQREMRFLSEHPSAVW